MNKISAKKKVFFTLAFFFAGVFFLGLSSQGKVFLRSHFPEVFLNDGKTGILPLGDSLTVGSIAQDQGGLKSIGGYRWPLWQELARDGYKIHFLGTEIDGTQGFSEPFHEGHIGIKSDGLLARLPQILSRWHPDIILLLIGTNDVAQGRPQEQIIANTKQILEFIEAQLPHCQILFSGPLPTRQKGLEENILLLNESLKQMLEGQQNQNIQWVDLYHEAQLNPSGDDFSDDVHPTQKGYDKIAQVWHEHLRSILIKSNSH